MEPQRFFPVFSILEGDCLLFGDADCSEDLFCFWQGIIIFLHFIILDVVRGLTSQSQIED